MEKKWTEDQKKVIDSRNKNLLVSAAAGSGKTAVLVARIIKMITDKDKPVDIDRLVVITFTKAAAAQMKQKISDELEKLIETEPENALYRRQYHLLGNASICTIDSFCLNLVRSYFQKLDLDPAFRIADETELELIRSDCMDALMEKYYEEADDDFQDLIEAYCGYKSDEKLTQYIFNLARKADAMPWPKEWLDSLVKEYDLKDADQLDKSNTAFKVVEHAKAIIKGCLIKINYYKSLCMPDGAPDYLSTLSDDENIFMSLLTVTEYSRLGKAINGIKYKSLSPKKTGSEEIKEEIREGRKKYKDDIKKLVTDFYYSDIEDITGLIQKSLPAVKMLVKMTKEYLDLFEAQKREKNVLDFSDAEHFALNILWDDSPEALELRKQYSEIIIDEYQDSNNVQEYIANAIAGRCDEQPYIFTVGDVKQSIYKFRNACPELFVRKQKLYNEKKDNGELIILDNNFRSREEVLNSTNAVFMHVMHESIGGITYDKKCSLKKGTDKQLSLGDDSPYKTEVHIITPEDGEKDILDESEGKIALEAQMVAGRIKELIYKDRIQIRNEDDEEKNTFHDVKFGDIVILLRTMKEWSSVFTDVLEAEGIPVFSDESDGFFKSQEITLTVDLLRILDNPRQDVPLASVLHSCIAKMDENDLADIRIAAGNTETFYDAVLKIYYDAENKKDHSLCESDEIIPQSEEADIVEKTGTVSDSVNKKTIDKLIRFFEIYNELDEYRKTASVSMLIEKIYELTGLYHYYMSLPDGDRRKSNLDMLPAYAVKFESSSYSGLFGFIRYYEKLKSRELDYGEAGSKAAGNSVRIMSIHKSKGLEFPVVFVCGTGKEFNLKDYEGDICISSDEGIGLKYIDLAKRKKYPSLYSSVKKMLGIQGIIGEEMRLLYVAMTRAKDKLILTGFTKDYNLGTDYASLFKSKHLIDFICPVLEVEKEYFKTVIYSLKSIIELSSVRMENSEINDSLNEAVFDTDLTDLVSAEIQKIVSARDFKYYYSTEEILPIKMSVSDLKHQQIEDEFGENVFEETREFRPGDKTLPDFMKSEEKVSKGTDYGTLVHKCMQFIPMNLNTDEEIEAFLSLMVKQGKLTEEEKGRLSVNKLVQFMKSPIADRIRKADAKHQFYREKQFMILVEACEINSEKYGSDNRNRIPIQGVIDAMFVEDGELVILDYKTDKQDKDGEEKLVKLYKRQLEIYALAAERLLGIPVKEKLLYSFSMGKIIAIDE